MKGRRVVGCAAGGVPGGLGAAGGGGLGRRKARLAISTRAAAWSEVRPAELRRWLASGAQGDLARLVESLS